MYDQARILTSLCFGAALLGSGCGDEGDDGSGLTLGAEGIFTTADDMDDETGNMDGNEADPDADTGDGDGDGDPTTDTGEPACDGTSPYMGGWDIGCCQDEIVPTAWAPGGVGQNSVLPDWTFTDQFGEAVRIYDFCHNAIYFEYVALW